MLMLATRFSFIVEGDRSIMYSTKNLKLKSSALCVARSAMPFSDVLVWCKAP
jgi:hypothetical protein